MSEYPKPISYRHALKILYQREDPVAYLTATNYSRTVAHLRKRASVRIVADLFGTTPAQVAEHLMNTNAPHISLDFSGNGLKRPDDKTLWSKGKGAW
jgi:hypothetical protein